MSGRSAHVRKKNDRKSTVPRNSVSGVQIVPANAPRSESVDAVNRYQNDQSPGIHPGYYDHGPKPYYGYQGYPQEGYGSPPRQPRTPLVIASAIEKSDIRSQVDGLSDNFRGKLGRMFGGKSGEKDKGLAERGGTWDGVSTDSTPPVNEVPSLIHSNSTDPTLRSAPVLPYHSPRPKAASSHQVGPYGHYDSSVSLPSQGRPEIAQFSGHRENRGRRAWRNLSRSPENLAPIVDTLVRLFAPSQTSHALAAFHINSQVLHDTGHTKWLEMLGDYIPPMGDIPDNATISSQRSNADYVTEGGNSQSDHPRSHRHQNIKFELVLDCPDDGLDIDPMSWVMTTRNYFAILHDHDSLCGRTLFEALSHLMIRLKEDSDYSPPTKYKSSFILDFLSRHRFLDVRNNVGYAISMLAFSQQPSIQWKEAAIESFVHCAGMRMYGALNYPEAQHLSPYTNILITNMSNELKQRLKTAQKHFASFDFSEMWPTRLSTKSGGRAAYERFRSWLSRYMARGDPGLPDSMARDEIWMSHERVQRYTRIFHSLFDYLVNRDVEFDGSEYQTNERWAIVSKSGIFFKPDPTSELPMTEILNDFDKAKSFPHLPAPYPLVPPSIPAAPKAKSSGKKSAQAVDESLESKSNSYTEASNFFLLGHDSNMDPIISEFVQFEQNDEIQNVDPRDARLGRWVLIYGALQILATIETVTPGVRYKDGVRYCMSCKVSGVLPWIKEREGEPQEPVSPSHQMAYPFTVPATWPTTIPKPRTTSYIPIKWGDYGDGRKRADLAESPPTRTGELPDRPLTGHSATVQRTSSVVKKDVPSARASGRAGQSDSPLAGSPPSKEVTEADKARGRRKKAFGFSDYRPEPGW